MEQHKTMDKTILDTSFFSMQPTYYVGRSVFIQGDQVLCSLVINIICSEIARHNKGTPGPGTVRQPERVIFHYNY